ncbi:hypothetical protein HQ524_01685 [Candidatus Uhrbacteria bacterium]|nr:hypothetical protein [Candidatus Uhrbacteria bacterium]
MQLNLIKYIRTAFVAVIILGSFALSAPMSVHANTQTPMPAMDKMAASDSGCDMQECTQQRSACQTHCIDDSASKKVVVASTVSHSDNTANVAPRRTVIVDHSIKQNFSIARLNRTPPTQKLLRSVMKRE